MSDTSPSIPRNEGWVTRKLRGLYLIRDAIRAQPVWALIFFIVTTSSGWIASQVASDAWAEWKGPDKYLVQLAEEQRSSFDELKKSLGQLAAGASADSRGILSNARASVRSLEESNKSLLAQLRLAKSENEALVKNRGPSTVAGGYDFILSGRSGVRVDATTVVGLRSVVSNSARISLTSGDRGGSEDVNLQAGQSVSYVAADARRCTLTALSVADSQIDTASFAVSCA